MTDMIKTKVIIITFKTAYCSDNSTPKEGREKFCEAILNQNNNAIEASPSKVKQFLQAMDEVNQWEDISGEIYNLYGKDISESKQEKNDAIRIIMENHKNAEEDAKAEEGERDCHSRLDESKAQEQHETEQASFKYPIIYDNSSDDEVILVLWDELGREREEIIEPFDLFIENLCKDCGVSQDGNSILYVHDKQLRGGKEDVILKIKDDGQIKSDYQEEPYFETLKKYFKYVATFGHSADSGGIFHSRILNFRFRDPTDAELISDKESDATTFQGLREEADNILDSK